MKSILHLKFTFFYFLFFSFLFTYGQSPGDFGFTEGVNFNGNVTYKSGQVMDIFYPDAAILQEKNPWVVFVHGGGWAGGEREDIYKSAFIGALQKLVENGVIVSTIEYRRARDGNTSFESAIDCKDAARFLLKNTALYKLDEEDYGIWGGSAGGHLALVTALVPDSRFPGDLSLSDVSPDYKGVLAYYPATSLLNSDLAPNSIFADGTLYERLLGDTVANEPVLAESLSPTEFLDASSLPVLLIHGNNDTTLPIINSTYMEGIEKDVVELITVVGGGHSFSGNNISPSLDEIAIKSANFFLSKFGYPEIPYVAPLQEPIEMVVDLPPAFEPTLEKIYNIYSPRWDRRMAANGGDVLTVLAATETATTVQWKFTPVSGEDGFYYMDAIGGGAKPRATAGNGTVSIMEVNAFTGDSAKWRFDYYGDGEDLNLFHITNKNGQRLRSDGTMVDIVASNTNGTWTRYSFSESTSLSIDRNVLKENSIIYPVPFTDVLHLTFKESVSVDVTLLDVTGKIIISKKIEGNNSQLDLSHLTSGFYILKMKSDDALYVQNVIKK